jgi:hypothetical protein
MPRMDISVREAIQRLDRQGLVVRSKELFLESMIAHIVFHLGQPLPSELEALYRERVARIAAFKADLPHRWGRMGFGYRGANWIKERLPVQAISIFGDGCGNEFCLDLSPGERGGAVYFFDHEVGFEEPQWAAGSTLGRFLMLLSLHDQSYQENWEPGWELEIDPDIDICPRARAIWNTV